MSKHQKTKAIRSQTGLAYVAILLLLTVLSTMGFAFLFKVGIETAATETRGKSMQTHYLAESAANHALWRLLNEPGFNPAADTYYMHSLGNGRYGYKIRKPTETTFATVATVGATGDSVANQSYVQYIIPSNVFTAYGSSTNAFPFYRRLIGANWTDPADVNIGGATTYWAELEGCPTRKELIAAFIDSADAIKVTVYDGTAWGTAVPFGHGDMNYKCFDIAYESQSGEALVVGRDGTATPLYYNIWDGSAWAFATPQVAFSLPGGSVGHVVMASQPGSDEILIAVVTSSGQIQLVRWDGSAFQDLGTIETTASRDDTRVVEIIYEHQSGDAMVVWARNGDSALKFRMWNGAALSLQGDLPDFNGMNNFWIRGAADSDPTSDYIVIAALDNSSDINVAVWDGDAWIDSREIEISGASSVVQAFDVAWEAAGEDALIAWAPLNATNVRSIAWKKGTALADCAIQEGPDLQNQGWLVRLLPIAGTQKIVLLGQNNLKDLRYCLWTGDGFKGDPTILLEADIPVQNELAFDLAEANVPRTGGSSSGENQPPAVNAGPDQTIYLPGDATLDGTVTDDGLPNPPATVTTTWSKTSGPGTVTFGDASQVDTTATFSDAGTYVLRLRADDSHLTAVDQVTIIVISCTAGNFRDEFTTAAYNNSDGSLGWAGDWIELDVSGAGPWTGKVVITGGELRMNGSPSGDDPSLAREIDLSGHQSATLSFSFRTGDGLDAGQDSAVVEVSDDGGNNWNVLEDFINAGPSASGTRSYDITAYMAANTQVRFRINLFYGGSNEYFYVDNVDIDASCESTLCNGLAGYWELDETSGTLASDSSGKGNNGTLTNMDPATDWIAGHIEGGLDFDGINDHVLVPDNASLTIDSKITIAAWICNDTLSAYDAAVAKGLTGTGDTYNYWFGTHADEICFGFALNGSWWDVDTTEANLQTNTWYHIAVTYDNTQDDVRIYLNGGELFNGSMSGDMASTTNAGPLYLGRIESGTDIFDGTLDEVRIYNRVLSPGEIAQLHALTEGGCAANGSCSGNFADDFETHNYTGSTGTKSWASDWIEVNESGDPYTGDEIVALKDGDYAVRVQDNDLGGEGVERAADLSAYSSATLSFEYRREGLDAAYDYVRLMLSGNGGGSWTEVARFQGPAYDWVFTPVSYDITSFIGTDTRIRFISSASLGSLDSVWFDNVDIQVSGCAGP